AARLRAGRLADELDDDRGLDRLVEANLLQVEVLDLPPQRVDLVVLENRRVRGLLACEHDVEDRVEPCAPREHPSKLALLHTDRVGLVPAAVEDPWDQAVTAQPTRLPRPAVLALLHFQTNPFSGHTGGEEKLKELVLPAEHSRA